MDPIIDDLSTAPHRASNGAAWQLVSDRVMGGVSSGSLSVESVADRKALRLRGQVSLENNGGFLQLALDLAADGSPVDASAWAGLEVDVYGNGARYNLHLRTADVRRPWQSYRQSFTAAPTWRTERLPFEAFEPHRLDVPLDLTTLRRIGIVAIGRAFEADIAVGGVRFFA